MREFKYKYGQELFEQLNTLVKSYPDSFMSKDFPAKQIGFVFRIFSYEIPKTSEFNIPGALDSRGTLFYVNLDSQEAQLLALPMRKFFSLGETLESQKLRYQDAVSAYIKEDGSLLTSYVCPEDKLLKFKSQKQPTFKEYDVVLKSVSPELNQELTELWHQGICVDMELTTPKNRVFLEYDTYTVHVLLARNWQTGEKINIRQIAENYPAIKSHLVKQVPVSEIDLNKKGIEGYVVEMNDGSLYKVKTIPYLSMSAVINMQDRTKEKIYMYQAALDGVMDDIKSLYHYRTHSPNFPIKEILEKLEQTEEYAKRTYLDLVKTVNQLHEDHKHLDRASYAKTMQSHPQYMPLLMSLYAGKTVDFKAWAVKLYGHKRD